MKASGDQSDDKIGRLKTTINIAKAFVGASSFSLPWAFQKAGIFGATFGIIGFAILSNITLCLLPRLGSLAKVDTFPQIGEAAFGFKGKMAVWFGMLAMTLGVCGSYLVFVAKNLSDLLYGYHQKDSSGVDQFEKGLGLSAFSQPVCVLLVLPYVIVLSLMGSHRFLSKTSAIGIFAVITACVFVVVDCTERSDTFNSADYYFHGDPAFNISGYPSFLGNAAYLYLITTAILPAHRNMREPQHFRSSFTIAQVIVTIANLGFAGYVFMGYTATHNGVEDNIISNLRAGLLTTIVKSFMSLNELFTFVLFLNPMVDNIMLEIRRRTVQTLDEEQATLQDSLLSEEDTETPGDVAKAKTAGAVVRVVLVLCTAGVAIAVPKFGVLTGFTGGFGNNLLAFVYVPLFYCKLQSDAGYWENVSCKTLRSGAGNAWSKFGELLLMGGLFFFGCAMLILSTVSSIMAIA